MNSTNNKKIPDLNNLEQWIVFIKENPLPDLKAKQPQLNKEFALTNFPSDLIVAMNKARQRGIIYRRIADYLAVATRLAIARSVAKRVYSVFKDRDQIIENVTNVVVDIALDPGTSDYTFLTSPGYGTAVKRKVVDELRKRKKTLNIVYDLPDVSKLFDWVNNNASEASLILQRAFELLTPTEKKALVNHLSGAKIDPANWEAHKVALRRARTKIRGYLYDCFVMPAGINLFMPDTSDLGPVDFLRFIILSVYDAQPSEADVQKWVDQFPEHTAEIRQLASDMEGLVEPDEDYELSPEEIRSALAKHQPYVV